MSIYPATMQFSQGGQFMEIAIKVDMAGAPTTVDCGYLKTDIWDNLKSMVNTYTNLDKITMGSGGTYVEVNYTGQSGSQIGVPCTPNQCYHVRKLVASGRPGSFFFPGVYAGAYDSNGQASSTLQTNMATKLAAMFTALGGHGIGMQVPQHGGGTASVSGFQLRNTVGNQRRRLH